MTTVWPKIRAGLIALAIFVGLLEGCPVPNKEQEQHMPDAVVSTLHALDDTRVDLLRPFKWIGDLSFVHQRWKLFAGANKKRYRMSVDALGPDGWVTLYRPLDDEHTFMEDQLAYRRMRGSWAPRGLQGPRGAYQHFVRWIAREVFASDPRWTEVRVQMEEVRIGDSGDWHGTGKFVYPMGWRREDAP